MRYKDARPMRGMKGLAKCLFIHHPILAKRCTIDFKNRFNHRSGGHPQEGKTRPYRLQWAGDDDWIRLCSFQQSQLLRGVETNR
jgi:hypothetical protein